MIRVIAIMALLLSGCATEHASKLANMDKWQANCSNAGIERQLYIKNIILLEHQGIGIGKENDAVRREKIAILNELILDSDRRCGPKQSFSGHS
jgi:hypothetical protein